MVSARLASPGRPQNDLDLPWQRIMRRAPLVCPRCSRRYSVDYHSDVCGQHLPTTRIKLWDQSDIIAGWD